MLREAYHVNEFDDGGRYHIETSPFICSANQWTSFYMIAASVMKELMNLIPNEFSYFIISIFMKIVNEKWLSL